MQRCGILDIEKYCLMQNNVVLTVNTWKCHVLICEEGDVAYE